MNGAITADAASEIAVERRRLQRIVVTATLWLWIWIAVGNLARAVAEADGGLATRSVLLGAVPVAALAVAIACAPEVARRLASKPWWVVPIGLCQLAIPTLDGIRDSPHVSLALTGIGLAVVVARTRTVWLLVVLLATAHAGAVIAGSSVPDLRHDGDLGGVAGALVSYLVAALVLLSVRVIVARVMAGADGVVDGGGQRTPSLLEAGRMWSRLLPPGPSPLSSLTRREVMAVEGLARGQIAKQIAHEWGMSLASVRTHIRNAKRKTGARTLPELAALTAAPDWPGGAA